MRLFLKCLAVVALLGVTACESQAEPQRAESADRLALINSSLDLLFGNRRTIDFPESRPLLFVRESREGECAEQNWLPQMFGESPLFPLFGLTTMCAMTRSQLANYVIRHEGNSARTRHSVILVDTFGESLSSQSEDLLSAQIVSDGFFSVNHTSCQLYLRRDGSGSVDLIVVRLGNAPEGFSPTVHIQRECMMRSVMRAFPLYGASDLTTEALFLNSDEKQRCFDKVSIFNRCDLFRNPITLEYIESLIRRGLIKTGGLSRNTVEAQISQDPEIGRWASLHANFERRSALEKDDVLVSPPPRP